MKNVTPLMYIYMYIYIHRQHVTHKNGTGNGVMGEREGGPKRLGGAGNGKRGRELKRKKRRGTMKTECEKGRGHGKG